MMQACTHPSTGDRCHHNASQSHVPRPSKKPIRAAWMTGYFVYNRLIRRSVAHMQHRIRMVIVAGWMILAVCGTSFGQNQSQSKTETLTSATCPGSGCFTLSVSGVGGLGLQVTGTYSGTLVVEGSIDGTNFDTDHPLQLTPPNSTTAVTSITGGGTGLWQASVGGFTVVRVRMSVYTSGSARVSLQNAPTTARSSGSGGATIGGTIADEQIAVGSGADTIGGSDFLTWDGSTLTAATDGDSATDNLALSLTVHAGGMNEATFSALIVGNSGDNEPLSGFSVPADFTIIRGATQLMLIGNSSVDFANAVDGDAFGMSFTNTSDTASSAVAVDISTTGDTATGSAYLGLNVHSGGADEATFSIEVAGNSGNATPATEFAFPGAWMIPALACPMGQSGPLTIDDAGAVTATCS